MVESSAVMLLPQSLQGLGEFASSLMCFTSCKNLACSIYFPSSIPAALIMPTAIVPPVVISAL